MFNMILVMTLVFGQEPRPCLLDQMDIPPQFGCAPYRIERSVMDQVIGACEDTIELCMGFPPEPRDTTHGVEQPVKLLRYGPAGDHMVEPTIVATTWSLDAFNGRLIVVPQEAMPAMEPGDTREIRYQLVMYCKYWKLRETIESDSVLVNIVKQTVIKAYAEARSVTDSTDLHEHVFAAPPSSSPLHFVSNGVWLEAADQSGPWTFDHWTCSSAEVVFDPLSPLQHISESCWPLTDTAIFTAWYVNTSTSVHEGDIEGASAVWNEQGEQLTVMGNGMYAVRIYDVNGSLILHDRSVEGGEVVIPLTVPPGLYLALISTDEGAITQTFVNY